MLRRSLWIAVAAAVLFGGAIAAPSAHAVPITYSFSGLASGTLGGDSFSDSLVTFSMLADTDNVMVDAFGPGIVSVVGVPASVSVGINSGTLDAPVYVFVNHNLSAAGFGVGAPIMDMAQAMLGTYDMKSPFGPGTGTLNFNTTDPIATSMGDIVFANGFAISSPTFEAIGGVVVPEAGTLALVLPALGVMGAVVVRRRKK